MNLSNNPRWLLAGIFSLTACAPAPITMGEAPDAGRAAPDAASSPDAGTEPPDSGAALPDASEADAGPPDSGCAPYTHPSGGGCAMGLSWQALPAGPPPRDHHVTFLKANAENATLYVSGGLDEHARAVRQDLWYAQLSPSGEFEAWTRGPRPPIVQLGSAVTVSGERAYVVAGRTLKSDGRVADNDVVYSLGLGADGSPGQWRLEQPLPAARFHGSAETIDRFIFAIGGIETQPGLASAYVWRAEILADGVLSAWTEVTPLPEGRSHHSSFIHGRTLFVLGGLDGSGVGFPSRTYLDYLWADIAEDGSLSDWTRVSLPFGASTQSAIVLGDRVVLLGGFDEDISVVDTVRAAPITGGTLGAWETLSPLPFARAHVHHTPSWRGHVYSVGGNVGDHAAVDRVVGGLFE